MAQPIAATLSAARSRRPASNTNAPGPTPRAPTARPSGLSKPAYASSQERTLALMPWLDHYNTERPHTALAHRPPAARLRQSQLLGSTEETVASSRPASNHDRSGEPGQGSPKATGDSRRAASSRRLATPVTLAQGAAYA